MKKLLQKAMVFTLTAAMLIGTPMSASAAGLVDLYSIQKPGMAIDPENDVNTSGTGTVTNTESGSGILTDNEGKIKGIVLDRETVEAETGINETLTAEIILDGKLVENDAVIEDQAEAIRKLSEKIIWKLGKLNANGEFVQDTSLSKTLGIKIGAAGVDNSNNTTVDRRTLTLIPKKGTVAGKEIYVQASINSSYYFEDGEVKEYVNDIGEVKALAKVSIKEYTKSLEWKWNVTGSNVQEPKPYVNHAIDLSKYLVRNPETANDTITWAVSSTTKGVATITPAGVVTIKKANESFIVYAMGEKCERLAWIVAKTDVGEPASKVEIWSVNQQGELGEQIKKPIIEDVGANGKNEDKEIKVKAKLIATKKVVLGTDGNPATTTEAADAAKATNGKYKVGSKPIAEGDTFIEVDKADATKLFTPEGAVSPVQTLTITDNVVWDVPAKQAGIAGVSVDSTNDRMATITVSKDAQIGSATITAKTPKKSAKVTVKVSATLNSLKITNTEKTLYSGQTLQMTYERIPAGNKDSIKWEIEKVNGRANPNATINGKGLLTIRPTVEDGATINVILKSPKKGQRAEVTAERYPITVKQSSIDGITVTEIAPAAQTVAGVGVDNGRVVQKPKRAGQTLLDIPVNGRYTIDVTVGENVDTSKFTKDVAVNTLTYKNSNQKVVAITRSADGKLTITPKASGTAKITVSGIRATKSRDKVTGKAISTSFSVKVSQPVTSVILNKPEIVLVEKKKSDGTYQELKISGLKATFGPKQANKATEKKIAKWEVLKSGETEWVTVPKSKTNSDPNTSASLSYTLTPAPKAGDVYTVKVTTVTGLTRTSTVKVISPATALVIADKKMSSTDSEPNTFEDTKNNNKANQTTVTIGESFTMYPYVNIGTRTDAVWKDAGDKGDEYVADEVVSYTLNNKNNIVSINQKTGEVKAMKDGKVTITAKTATGKSAKLTVNVVFPTTEANR